MPFTKTRDRAGGRRGASRRPAKTITRSNLFHYEDTVVAGTTFFRYMTAKSCIISEPFLDIDTASADAELEVSITDENNTTTSITMPVVEGINALQSVTLPAKHRLAVTLNVGQIDGVWLAGSVLQS